MKTIITVLGVALLCGCVGTNFSYHQASQVKPGMSGDEVIAIMGKPYQFNSRGNKVEWIYAWGNLAGQARSVIFVFTNGFVAEVPAIPSSLINTNPVTVVRSPKGR